MKHKKYVNMTQDRSRDPTTTGTELSMTAVSKSK